MKHIEEAGAVVGIIVCLTLSSVAAKVMGIWTFGWWTVGWAAYVLIAALVGVFVVIAVQELRRNNDID